jgi:predicted alpha/beta-fold hydrolase
MGAGILTGLIGKYPKKCGIKAAVALACPFDFKLITHYLKY